MNVINEYEKKTKRIINYLMIGTALYICSVGIRVFTIGYEYTSKADLLGDIDGVNIVIGLIAICACFLYYYMYRETELFLLIFVYLSIWIEYTVLNTTNAITINNVHMLLSFIFRMILILMTIRCNDVLVCKITKNKKLFSIICVIVVVLTIILDMKLSKVYGKRYEEINVYRGFIITMYYYETVK